MFWVLMEILPQTLLNTFPVPYYDIATQLCLDLLSLIFAYDSWIWHLDFFSPLLYLNVGASLVAQTVKNPPAMWETQVRSLGREDPLEKEVVTHTVFLPGEPHEQWSLAGCSPWKDIAYLKDSSMDPVLFSIVHRVTKN